MNEGRSLFLDFARFVAAFAVVLHHAFGQQYLAPPIYVNGRVAVMVFFVISGFVIAYVADKTEHDWINYAISRGSRILIVAIPALLMTVAADGIGMHVDRHWYIENDHEHILARLLISLAFMNQAWNLTVSPLSNGPYWSLCYEVWYYVIFGVLVFVKPATTAYLIALALAALVGPRIMLLFSVWLIGVACYHVAKRIDTLRLPVFVMFALSGIHLGWIMLRGTPVSPLAVVVGETLAGEDGYLHLLGFKVFLGDDRYFINDIYLGLSFGLLLLFSSNFDRLLNRLVFARVLIRGAAKRTYSLYLYHAPLLVMFAAVTGHEPNRKVNLIAMLAATLVAAFVLSEVTEQQRPKVRSWLSERWEKRPIAPRGTR